MKTKPPTELPPLPHWGEKRLIKLIEFLEKLPRRKFDFNWVVAESKTNGHFCGTVCCAIGWTPAVFPRLVQWIAGGGIDNKGTGCVPLRCNKKRASYEQTASDLFGMEWDIAERLFSPNRQQFAHHALQALQACGATSTPKQVARMLRRYLKLTHAPKKP